MLQRWDYLLVTASNDPQARAYEAQLRERREKGLLPQAGEVLLVADPEGRRIGSGGSTLYCLAEVVNRELAKAGAPLQGDGAPERILSGLRILILHAGGDSRRLPAYGACGKIFVPLPGESGGALGPTLFDRLAGTLLNLPAPPHAAGQVVVASGDALLLFDPQVLQPAPTGVTALSNTTTAEEASRHGVFSAAPDGRLRRFLQKPSLKMQQETGLLNQDGKALLDLGLMSFDAATAARWLRVFEFRFGADGSYGWTGAMKELIFERGLDIYREICCALGSETGEQEYIEAAKSGGSAWDRDTLREIFPALHSVPMQVRVAPSCSFLHFGATRQLFDSGLALLVIDGASPPADSRLFLNSLVEAGAEITGERAWIEGCEISAPVTLGGGNVLVGVDIHQPLELPPGACLDVLPGLKRNGAPVWFVRCYGVRDTFKDKLQKGAEFCGLPLSQWLDKAGAPVAAVWDDAAPAEGPSLWNARVFPAVDSAEDYRDWLWMYNPSLATAEQKRAWLTADRYSMAEMAFLSRLDEFHGRRARIREKTVRPESQDDTYVRAAK